MIADLDQLSEDAMAIVRAGIAAVDPAQRVSTALARSMPHGPVGLIAVGKAAGPMALAARQVLGAAIDTALVISPDKVDVVPPFQNIVAGHPVPNTQSIAAGERALALARALPLEGTLLVLLSGGASALLAVPAGDLTLDDKARTTSTLLRSGADIVALNTVRKHLSAIKGGWLAASTPAACQALVISDVVGDDVSVIGSGPTVPDSTTFADAREVLRRFGGEAVYPSRVVRYLQAGAGGTAPETPKPGDARLARASTSVVATRLEAMEGAAREGGRRGYHVARLDEPVVGEARLAAQAYLQNLMPNALPQDRPLCLLSSGETTVHVSGSGMGGRNQEFALALVPILATWPRPSVLASVGTDGIDGPTDAAGALVSTTTSARATALGLAAPADYLERNDAYGFLDAVGDLVRTGPTGTNVGDLQVLLLGVNRQSTSARLRTGQ